MYNTSVKHVKHDTCWTMSSMIHWECIMRYINMFFTQQRRISLFFFSCVFSKYWNYISTIDWRNLYLKSYLFAIFLYFFCLNISSCYLIMWFKDLIIFTVSQYSCEMCWLIVIICVWLIMLLLTLWLRSSIETFL